MWQIYLIIYYSHYEFNFDAIYIYSFFFFIKLITHHIIFILPDSINFDLFIFNGKQQQQEKKNNNLEATFNRNAFLFMTQIDLLVYLLFSNFSGNAMQTYYSLDFNRFCLFFSHSPMLLTCY